MTSSTSTPVNPSPDPTPLTSELYKSSESRIVLDKENQEKNLENRLRSEFRKQLPSLRDQHLELYRNDTIKPDEEAFIFTTDLFRKAFKPIPNTPVILTTIIKTFFFLKLIFYFEQVLRISQDIVYTKPSTKLISLVNKYDITQIQKLDEGDQLTGILFNRLEKKNSSYKDKWEDIYVYYGILNMRFNIAYNETSDTLGKKEYLLNYILSSIRVVKGWIKGVIYWRKETITDDNITESKNVDSMV